MPVISFPASLPAPSVAPLTPTERRYLSPLPGARQQRARERDFNAQQRVEWAVLSRAQLAVLRAWWHDDLIEGGAWFAAAWPMPEGRVVRVRKFLGEPERIFLGNGRWRVTAVCEVRGRGELPRRADPVYTSWPYALIFGDSIDTGRSLPSSGFLWRTPQEELEAGHSLPLSGTLIDVLRLYEEAAPDELDAGHSLPTAGTLIDVLRTYDDAVPDTLDAGSSTPLSGTLIDVLRTYTNAAPDELTAGSSIPLGGTLS